MIAATAEDMQRLGEKLGSSMAVGDVLALVGQLGSGKTTFTQGLARGLGVPSSRHVASPTFALCNEHPGRVPLVHVDFYRIKNAAELLELGLAEAFDRAAVAIEWADRFTAALPADHLIIRIETDGPSGGRRLVAAPTGPRSSQLLQVLGTV